MEKRGYSSEYSAALTGASATIGPIFPPSIPLIIFGLYAEVSVLKLLIAGIGPAIILVLQLMVVTIILSNRGKFPEPSSRASLGSICRSFFGVVPALAAPIILIGGMIFGYFSPSEVAAVTTIYILLIAKFFYPPFSVRDVRDASREAGRTTAQVLIILAAAGVFAFVMSIEGITDTLSVLLLGFSNDPIVLLLLVNLLLLIIGMFIDPLAALAMTVPFVVPTLTQVGYDPVHIGVIMVLNLMVGMLTPPLGISLYVASDISGAEVLDIVKELIPYYFILLITLLIVSLFPRITLYALRFL
jgi:tripartite ATP-independent transporter DctM subunit